jgi:hypothetical protein
MKILLLKSFALLTSVLLAGCVMSAQERSFKRAKISLSNKCDHTVFHINEVAAGIVYIQVTDEVTGEILWHVNTKHYKRNVIIYGDMEQFLKEDYIPARPPKQLIPKNAGAPSIKNKLIRVRLGMQYDSFMSANSGDIEEQFQM